METIVIITSVRELFLLHRWLLVKVAKEPKTAMVLLRLMLFGRTKDHRKKRNVKVKLDKV